MLLLQVHYKYLCSTANPYQSLRKYHKHRRGVGYNVQVGKIWSFIV